MLPNGYSRIRTCHGKTLLIFFNTFMFVNGWKYTYERNEQIFRPNMFFFNRMEMEWFVVIIYQCS